jgi:hypothetical protein
MNNLIIGNTYYFLIDGCAGAYCDVEIDVVGVCGSAEIAPWTQNVSGPLQICAGSSATHIAQDLHGATHYHWYINGVLVTQGLELTSFVNTWNTPGIFEICVDASNDPCIPESNPPPQNCITVEVFAAEAGSIVATPTPVCPNNTVSITASGFETGPGYQQYIVITNSSGIIVAVVPGGSTTFTHNMCATFTAYSYNYHNSGTNSPPVVGNPVSTVTCSNGCCDSASAPFSFVDTQSPVLLNPPASITLTCYDHLPAMVNLNWTDNCDGTGSVPGVQTGTANLCNGGTLTRTWQYTDVCGNLATHVQTITINTLFCRGMAIL